MSSPNTRYLISNLLVVVAALALAACKGDAKKPTTDEQPAAAEPVAAEPAAAKQASCDVPNMFSCKQYGAANLELGVDSLKGLCDSVEGTFELKPCPADKQLGACAKPEGTDVYYEGYPIPVDDVAADCASAQGKWQAP